jgi:hypothetical protein
VVFAGLLLCLGVFAQSPGKIEIGKMNPAGLLVDKCGYMAQPYSFYYFHHMDLLGPRTDWIQKAKGVYPLREPAREWVPDYTFRNSRYSLDDYFKRNYVTGFPPSGTRAEDTIRQECERNCAVSFASDERELMI